MKYLLLIYSSEAAEAAMMQDPVAVGPYMAEYNAFTAETRQPNVFVGGEALQPTATVTDSPFTETKEQLGGYYLLDCKDLDEAIEFAGKIPSARHGSIEVRPIQEFN